MGLGTISSMDAARGFATISEARAQEKINDGVARTEFMKYGDRVRIDACDAAGQTIFGAIEQTVTSSRRRRNLAAVEEVVAEGVGEAVATEASDTAS